MFDGAPFGFEGEVRISFAGTGDRATMTLDDANGARAVFTLTRIAAQDENDKNAQNDKSDENAEKENAEKKNDRSEQEKAERLDLWKNQLPYPFGEHGLTSQPVAGKAIVKGATIWTLGEQGTLRDAPPADDVEDEAAADPTP
jgi:uncharacterized membrane protein YdbT with pleckstrin-like domain